jgi:acetylornithine deacetylase/succinyl-diaminopimelate desuccinylase-like protein
MRRRWAVPLAVAVAGTLAVLGLRMWNDSAAREIGQGYYIPKEAKITPAVVELQNYVRIDTTNPPGNETAGARYLAALLERGGVHAEIVESAPGRGNVYARIRGKRRGEGLLLLNHIDVVPPGPAKWTHPPFSGEIALNQLYGRGTLDMKGIAICQAEAMLAVARRHAVPERDVVFLATADEEQFGAMGVAWLLRHRPDIFEGIRYTLNEGGINESLTERLTYVGIEIGSKMIVKARLRGPSREAMERLRIALEPYASPREAERVLPGVRVFMRDIAPMRVEQRPLLEDVDRTIAQGKFWLLSRSYRELAQNIAFPASVIPDQRGATMEVSLFNLPDEDPDRRLAWLRDFARPYGAAVEEVLEKSGPAPLSPRDTPLFTLLAGETRRAYGDVPVGTEVLAAATNDSRYLRARGIVCYGWWPFQVDFFQTQSIHSADERVRVDWFAAGVDLMQRVVLRYATEP